MYTAEGGVGGVPDHGAAHVRGEDWSSDVVDAYRVMRAVFPDPDQAISGPKVFADQRGRARDIVRIILRNPVAPNVVHRVDSITGRQAPDALSTKEVVFLIGSILIPTPNSHMHFAAPSWCLRKLLKLIRILIQLLGA